jgi:hypothetical protein
MQSIPNPRKTIFQTLTYDNYFLNQKCDNLIKTMNGMQNNLNHLNRFIRSHYDLCFNVISNIKIITFDSADTIISCIQSDSSGNFVGCNDLSMNYLPCVLNPTLYVDKISKTHMTDVSNCDDLKATKAGLFYNPYYDPYYGPRYGPYYGPYHGPYYNKYYDIFYPYKTNADDDDNDRVQHFNTVAKDHQQPNNASTHIHIHPR